MRDPENLSTNENVRGYCIIACEGMDGKNHFKVSWEEKALCGMKMQKSGFQNNKFTCSHCDGAMDKL